MDRAAACRVGGLPTHVGLCVVLVEQRIYAACRDQERLAFMLERLAVRGGVLGLVW